MGKQIAVLVLACTRGFAADAADPLAIVRQATARERAGEDKARDWTYTQELIDRSLDRTGKVTLQQSTTREVVVLYGRYVSRVVARDGKPLSGSDATKEHARVEKMTSRWAHESERERGKELQRIRESERKQMEFIEEIPRAFAFRLAGEEEVEGRRAWILDATPRSDFKARVSRADMLSKFRGRMWVDQEEYRLVKIDCETIDTVSFGFVLARIGKGAIIRLDSTRVEPGVWLPRHVVFRLDARLALFKTFRKEIELFNSDFKKFSATSNIAVSR